MNTKLSDYIASIGGERNLPHMDEEDRATWEKQTLVLIEYRETSNYGTALDTAEVSYDEAQDWLLEDVLGYTARYNEVRDRIGWDLHAEQINRFKKGEKVSPTLVIAMLRAMKPDLYAVQPTDSDTEARQQVMAELRKMNKRFDDLEESNRFLENALGMSGPITPETEAWLAEQGIGAQNVGIERVDAPSELVPMDRMGALRAANAETDGS